MLNADSQRPIGTGPSYMTCRLETLTAENKFEIFTRDQSQLPAVQDASFWARPTSAGFKLLTARCGRHFLANFCATSVLSNADFGSYQFSGVLRNLHLKNGRGDSEQVNPGSDQGCHLPTISVHLADWQ